MNFSTLKIYGTIPFQKDYKHTIDFESKTEQNTYFNTEFNKKGKSFSDFLYIDEYQKIIVEGAKGKFDGYNYLSFVNGDSNRTFYCFIDRFEYVSEDSTAIYFTVDVMQTYMFDYELKESLVEKEHVDRWNSVSSKNFTYAKCIEDEISDYNTTELINIDRQFVFVNIKNDKGYTHVIPYAINHKRIKVGDDILTTIGEFLNSTYIETVIGLYVTKDYNINYSYSEDSNFYYFSNVMVQTVGTLKLLTGNKYTGTTKTITYKLPYELITSPKAGFNIYNEVKLFIEPYTKYYFTDNISMNRKINNIDKLKNIIINEVISQQEIPITTYKFNDSDNIEFFNEDCENGNVPFTKDQLTLYAINNIVPFISKIAASITSNNIPVDYLLNITSGIIEKGFEADSPVNYNEDSLSKYCSIGNVLTLYKKECKQFLIIANRFNKYGYLIRAVKTPNINSRYWFNYIKTIECNLDTNLHQEIADKLKEIFNNGITFWHYNSGSYLWKDYTKNNVERSLAT